MKRGDVSAKELCERMDRLGLRVPELARRAGASMWTIYCYRQGRRRVPPEIVEVLDRIERERGASGG